MPIVTLLTDFGLKDSYVAEMKGVLYSRIPDLTVVDITHAVSPYKVEEGAFQLLRSYRWFPEGTFHLVVVDPGVGSARRGLYAETALGRFIGPDNGVLLWAIRDAERRSGRAARLFEIPQDSATSITFHGRDLFAPFAAEMLEKRPSEFSTLANPVGREFPSARAVQGKYLAEVIHVDHFGNIISSLRFEEATQVQLESALGVVQAASCYANIAHGGVGLIRGSHGFWEIAACEQSASKLLQLKSGDPLTFFPTSRKS